MTDLRGRHGRNFQGCHIQVSGDDEKLNAYLDRLDFVPGCLVMGRADTTEGNGVLFIQAMKASVQNLQMIAVQNGLTVRL